MTRASATDRMANGKADVCAAAAGAGSVLRFNFALSYSMPRNRMPRLS